MSRLGASGGGTSRAVLVLSLPPPSVAHSKGGESSGLRPSFTRIRSSQARILWSLPATSNTAVALLDSKGGSEPRQRGSLSL